jgi:pantothenate kinase type III
MEQLMKSFKIFLIIEQLHPEINVILTGGDTTFIKSIVSTKKNSIFADENLTLKGLNTVLIYNA